MGQTAGAARFRRGLAYAVVALAAMGCAAPGTPPPASPGASGEPEVAVVVPSAGPRHPERSLEPPIALIVDDPEHSQLEVPWVFSARLGRPYRVLNLAHRSAESVREELEGMAPGRAVTLGSRAFAAAATVPGVDVYYAGVLNPGTTTQGVDALPPFDVQLEHWLSLAPEIRRVGVAGSAGMAERVNALAAACAGRGLTLEQRIVRSDKELLLAFRSMVPHIDGFVVLPDEAVLSPRVIAQVMSHGRRNDVQTLVYSPVMFNLGATLYLRPDPVRVAESLIELMNDPRQPRVVREIRSRSRLRPPEAAGLKLAAAGAGDG